MFFSTVTVAVGSSYHKRAVLFHIISQHHNTSKSLPVISGAPTSRRRVVDHAAASLPFLGVKNGPQTAENDFLGFFSSTKQTVVQIRQDKLTGHLKRKPSTS